MMIDEHEARQMLAVMPADAALELLHAAVNSLQPENLPDVLNSTLKDVIIASLIVALDAYEEKADGPAGMN